MIAPYTEGQLTPWFGPLVKPPRPGVYQVRMLHRDRHSGHVIDECFALYDGRLWSEGKGSLEDCIGAIGIRVAFQNKLWRGLNFDPSPPAQASAKTALQQFAESIEFSGPDDDGLCWMSAGVPGGLKVGVNLGPEAGIVARAAAQLEQLRVRALAECNR